MFKHMGRTETIDYLFDRYTDTRSEAVRLVETAFRRSFARIDAQRVVCRAPTYTELYYVED